MSTFRTTGSRRLGVVAVGVLLATAAACGRAGGPDGQARASAAITPTAQPEPTVGPAGSMPAEQDHAVPRRPLPVVSGEIYLRERVALPAGTVVKIRVVRLGAALSAPGVVAEVQLPAPRHMPIPFEVVCDPGSIEEDGEYGLEAEIVRGTTTVFTTASRIPVLAGGLPTSGIKLLLRRAG